MHSHYWLSGQAGRLAAAQWRVPLVHTMHTLARVKNAALADGDTPEPQRRIHGERAIVATADWLIANTPFEAASLAELYGADPDRTDVVRPGVDLRAYHPGDGRRAARARLGLPRDAFVLVAPMRRAAYRYAAESGWGVTAAKTLAVYGRCSLSGGQNIGPRKEREALYVTSAGSR